MILYAFVDAVYMILDRLFRHPLKGYPGPRLWASSRIPYNYNKWKGRLPQRISEMHERHGNPVIRIAPDELSIVLEEAWEGINGNAST